MAGLWGELGADGEIQALWAEFFAKIREAQEFGWQRFGVGGHWDIRPYYVPYVSGDPAAPARSVPEGFPPTSGMFQVASVFTEVEDTPACLDSINTRWFVNNYLFPQWFFDWGKRYLHVLRKRQPSFNAPVEEKMIWSTHVAWTVNTMLGSTNLHGAVLSMALYVEGTGDLTQLGEGNASFMYPTLHTRALPDYYHRAAGEEVKKRLAREHPADAVFSYGGFLYDKQASEVGQSLWSGAPWSTPLETRRLRWASPLWVGENCPRSGGCTPKIEAFQGLTYGNGYINDPYFPLNEFGVPVKDPSAATNYARWSFSIPWIMGVQSWGNVRSDRWAGSGNAMLDKAVRMSTLFAWDRGDEAFWEALDIWKRDPSPRFRPGFVPGTSRRKYTPNSEFSFRYYYPAMIDLLSGVDYASLVARGSNIWWFFNVGSVDTRVAKWAPLPNINLLDGEGKPILMPGGDALGPLVGSPGFSQAAKREYDEAEDHQTGVSFVINWARTLVAIIQAIYGQYGALVGAVRGWVEHATAEFLKPENLWKGVVPPTPFAQRLAPFSIYQGPGVEPSFRIQAAPDPIGSGNTTGQQLSGGVDVASMMASVRGSVENWERAGGPVIMSEDVINLLAARNPDAPRSPMFPRLPEPGTSSESAPAPVHGGQQEATPPPAPAPPPPAPEKGSPWAWLAGLGAAVGALTVYRVRRKDR